MAAGGCGTTHYRESADRQVYDILSNVHKKQYDSAARYDIEQLAQNPLQDLPSAQSRLFEIPETLKRFSIPPKLISLEKALEIAAYHNRSYQNRKEDVYLAALALTEEQNEFSSQFGGLLSGFWSGNGDDEFISGEAGLSIGRLLKTGASIGLNLSTEFLRYLTGDPSRTISSILAVSIIQPLWRGAGERIATENLKQAERNVVYAVRSFSRFRKSFVVDIASTHFRVLEQRAVVENEWRNFKNLALARDRAQMLATAGRLPEFQADQAKQNELRAKDRWTRAARLYYERLDSYKLDLGLQGDANVDLDNVDLERLVRAGIRHPDIQLEKSVSLALQLRQDLKNVHEQVDDARRRIDVAVNNLGADVDLVFNVDVPSKPSTHPAELRFDDASWNAGLDVDLPLERLGERNEYRRALIDYERAMRNLSLRTDEVKLDVADAWRSLQQASESFSIQRNSLKLAEQRVDSTTLLLQAGRVDTRDLLESQASLLEAQNALVSSLVDHTLARLRFRIDTGMLKADEPITTLIYQP